MSEVETKEPYKPIKHIVTVNYQCDMCGKGNMITDRSMCLTSMPPQWWMECDHCGDKQTSREKYPYTREEQ